MFFCVFTSLTAFVNVLYVCVFRFLINTKLFEKRGIIKLFNNTYKNISGAINSRVKIKTKYGNVRNEGLHKIFNGQMNSTVVGLSKFILDLEIIKLEYNLKRINMNRNLYTHDFLKKI